MPEPTKKSPKNKSMISSKQTSEPVSEEEPKTKKRIIEVVKTNGTRFTLELDATWKITFGALQNIGHSKIDNALRIYEKKDTQIACFRNVEEFRDLGIPMEMLFTANTEQVASKSRKQGKASKDAIKAFVQGADNQSPNESVFF